MKLKVTDKIRLSSTKKPILNFKASSGTDGKLKLAQPSEDLKIKAKPSDGNAPVKPKLRMKLKEGNVKLFSSASQKEAKEDE
jgi:hypothetical protein